MARESKQKVQSLHNGYSSQPPTSRLPNQVADAENVIFSVADGMRRRSGSWIQQHVAEGILPAGNNRIYPIVRDQDEKHIVIHNRTSSGAIVRVLELSTNRWATVDITSSAQAYLNAASPDEFRFRTIVDHTLILNTDVELGFLPGPDYLVSREFDDYDEMVSITPVDETYAHAREDGSQPMGYYQYDVDGITFATIKFATMTSATYATVTGIWNDSLGAPRGFLIYFRDFDTGAQTAATYTAATNTMTKANAFLGWTFESGHYLNVTGDGGSGTVVAGKRLITSKIDDSNVTLTDDTGFTGSPVDVTFDSICTKHDVSFGVIHGEDMGDVALAIQQAIRDTGQADDALCGWTDVTATTGYFEITSPTRGANAGVISVEAGTATSLAGVGGPFEFAAATVTEGVGTVTTDTLAVGERWTRVTAPNQPDALLDPETMPVKLVRENTGGDGTITAISVANPTSITSANHGLVTGQTIVVTGSNSTPGIDGSRVVTVTDANHFTIPVNVTIAGTTGSWISRAYFTIDVVEWNSRLSGNGASNPIRPLWEEHKKLSDLRYWRGRLWLMGSERVTSSQAGDLFNFWIENVNAIGDSDPIDVQLSSDQVTEIDYGVPVRDSLILFTKAGIQFEVSAGDTLTQSSIRSKPITRYRTLPAQPEVLDPNVYYGVDIGCKIHLYEYAYDEIALPSTAEDVSAHAQDLMPLHVDVPEEIGSFTAAPSELRRIAISSETGIVFLLRRDKVNGGEVFGNKVFAYRAHHLGNQKVQSAWTRWALAQGELTGIRGIHDIAVIGDSMYLLVHCGHDTPPDFFLIRILVSPETECDTAPDDLEAQYPETTDSFVPRYPRGTGSMALRRLRPRIIST